MKTLYFCIANDIKRVNKQDNGDHRSLKGELKKREARQHIRIV